MALSDAEKSELSQLEGEVGHLAPSGGLSASEHQELSQLENEVGHLAPKESAPMSMDERIKANAKKLDESGDVGNNDLLNSLTFGHLPQIKAKAGQVLAGEGIANDENYVKRRDQEIANMKTGSEKYPAASLEGKVAGFVLPMLATGGGSGAAEAGAEIAAPIVKQGLARAAVKGAAVGGTMGAAQNPGDTPGVVDPLQFEARKENAKAGAALGGTIGVVANKLPDLAEVVNSKADANALKGAGAMLKDFRKAYATDSVHDTGRFIRDNGLVKAGDTYESVAGKAEALREQTGKQLGDGYDTAAKMLPRLGPEAAQKVDAAGFNPVRDKAAVLSAVKNELGYSFKGRQALQSVSEYLDQLAEEHGNQTLNPKVTNQIKTALDKSAINWERNPLAREPDAEAALKSLREILNGKVSGQIDELGKAIGDPEAAAKLLELNQRYGMSSKVASIAGDRMNRELANNHFGLKETGLGVAGAMIGEHVAGFPGMIAGGAAGTGVSKVARTYGPQAIAAGTNAAAKALEVSPAAAGMIGGNPATYRAALTLVSKGPEKWMAAGMQNLQSHIKTDDDRATIEKAKEQLMSTPEGKKLLIAASDLKPGSRAMEDILSRVKKKFGESK